MLNALCRQRLIMKINLKENIRSIISCTYSSKSVPEKISSLKPVKTCSQDF